MRIADGYVLRALADKNIVIAVGEKAVKFRGILTLNDISKRIWEHLKDHKTFNELLAYILSIYDIDEKTAGNDLIKIIARMESNGLLELSKEDLRNQVWNEEESALAGYAASRRVPLVGMFELTARCNFNCKMCYVHMSAAEIATCNAVELTTAQWLRLAEQAANAGTLHLTLTGGEPLIRDDFEEIYTALSTLGFRLGVNTNGSLISPRYERLFIKYPPRSILVTLYGADAETYQKVCGASAAFDNVIRGLEFASRLPTMLNIRATFIQENKDQLRRVRDIAHKYSGGFSINPYVNMPLPGVSSDIKGCRLSVGECVDVIAEHAAYYNELQKNSGQARETANSMIDGVELRRAGEGGQRADETPVVLGCSAAKSMYHIKWDGRMYPCISFISLHALPLEEGFREAWDRLPVLLKGLRLPKKCSYCERSDVCSVCPARIESETGSFDEAPEYICDIIKELAARNIT